MAHKEQKEFLSKIRDMFPERFNNCSVLDIGSLDINGNNRYLFSNYKYTGIDIGTGPNVDIVCSGHNFKPDTLFDIVISTECFEHDIFYKETLSNAVSLLKPGGLLLFTCATTGREEHGTNNKHPTASPFTKDYYKNIEESDVRECIDIDSIFRLYSFEVNNKSHDLYFFGIKNE